MKVEIVLKVTGLRCEEIAAIIPPTPKKKKTHAAWWARRTSKETIGTFFFFFFMKPCFLSSSLCLWLKSDCPSRCHKRLNGPVALCNDMVAISRHSPMVNDSASSLFHAIVQLLMGPAATCPPYSVIRHGNGTFTPLEQQMTSFWQAIGRHNAHNTPTTF